MHRSTDVQRNTRSMDVVKEGYLFKRPASGGVGSIQKRWIVLTAQCVQWYKDEATHKALAAPLNELRFDESTRLTMLKDGRLSIKGDRCDLVLSEASPGVEHSLPAWYSAVLWCKRRSRRSANARERGDVAVASDARSARMSCCSVHTSSVPCAREMARRARSSATKIANTASAAGADMDVGRLRMHARTRRATATATATASATATSEGRPRGGRLMFFSSRKNQQRLGTRFFHRSRSRSSFTAKRRTDRFARSES